MPLDKDQQMALADDLLTYIEQRESEQIAYGIYDVTTTTEEVLDAYHPIDTSLVGIYEPDDLLSALQGLAQESILSASGKMRQRAGYSAVGSQRPSGC